ncbi:MAG: hypothetical protein M1814_000787 [Vezdaea aestivalis]|nr:MAG: hypothetical protein M1814_000787 [Vezdaea aestivalis]
MASYEVEHDVANEPQVAPGSRPRRPDLSTFFNSLSQVETSGTPDRAHNNANALPTPPDLEAVFRNLRDAFLVMQRDGGGNNLLLETMVNALDSDMDRLPKEVRGVSDEWLADRKDLVKKEKAPLPPKELDEEEEEWDEMYA